MIERCSSIWEPETPDNLNVQEHMGTSRNRLLKHLKTINGM